MFGKIKRFLLLSKQEQSLFIKAFLICSHTRLLVFLVPMRWYVKRLGEQGKESPNIEINDKSNEIFQVKKAIRRALRYLPGNTKCLAKAISTKRLLRSKGIPSTLYLGVAKEGENKIIAHAWLRCGSEIITGKEEMPRFTVVSFFT